MELFRSETAVAKEKNGSSSSSFVASYRTQDKATRGGLEGRTRLVVRLESRSVQD